MSETESILDKLDKIINNPDNNGDAPKKTPDEERADRKASVEKATRPARLHPPVDRGEPHVDLDQANRDKWWPTNRRS